MAWFFSRKKTVESADDVQQDALSSPAPTNGPFDEADHPERGNLLDAGALWLPPLPGGTVQFSTDRRRNIVLAAVYMKDGGVLQVQAYAAPKSRGIWDDIRTDMITSIAKQGGSSKEVEGPFGTELAAQMPVPNSNQPQPHRYIGIDGPRWLLRVTLYGRAGTDQKLANEFLDIVRKVVVVRGHEPHPPRELLPLTIPTVVKKPT